MPHARTSSASLPALCASRASHSRSLAGSSGRCKPAGRGAAAAKSASRTARSSSRASPRDD